ncbi:TraR/DksA family transcriptional regulator [Streptomyces sp. CA-111067]|uniref:TraR/DksA family transcriptional regulator n=1 Tax=Streptomyces sp. CA-111067 TaxID=3240046 RepID=UPI003D975233
MVVKKPAAAGRSPNSQAPGEGASTTGGGKRTQAPAPDGSGRRTVAAQAARRTTVTQRLADAPADETVRSPAEKTTAKKTAAKKATTKKAAAKKAAAKKSTAKKSTAKRAADKAAPAKKTTGRAGPAKSAGTGAKKTGAGKVAAKKSAVGTAAGTASGSAVPAARTAAEPGVLAVLPGEDPWTAEEVAEARTELLGEVERMRTEIASSEAAVAGLMRDGGDATGDEADTGSKNITRESELALAANTRETLVQAEHALHRLDEGTYGLCEVCGNPIGKARMQAFPRATLCLDDKQRQERR